MILKVGRDPESNKLLQDLTTVIEERDWTETVKVRKRTLPLMKRCYDSMFKEFRKGGRCEGSVEYER